MALDQSPFDLVYATEILLPIATQSDDPEVVEARPKLWFLSPVAAAVLVAVFVGVAVIAYLSFGSSADNNTHSRSDSPSTAIADHSVRSEPVSVPASTLVPTEPVETQTTNVSDPGKERPLANPVTPAPVKARPQIADAKPLNKTDDAPSDPAKAKKKVTVDDLINDN